MSENTPSHDWGSSSETNPSRSIEIINATFPHRRDERRSQLIALGILSIVSAVLVVVDAIAKTNLSKEALTIIFPAFTFFLGRMDKKSND